MIPMERCFTRCKQGVKQDSFGKMFHKVLRKKKNSTIGRKLVETNVWRRNEKTICREMRKVHFEKWNLNNINITCPLRLEFVEKVELLLRLFFVGRVFYK